MLLALVCDGWSLARIARGLSGAGLRSCSKGALHAAGESTRLLWFVLD